jgi:hypothetical protein
MPPRRSGSSNSRKDEKATKGFKLRGVRRITQNVYPFGDGYNYGWTPFTWWVDE